MSRIGKLPVSLPAGVEVKVSDNNIVTVKGPKGELQEQISKHVSIAIEDGVLTVGRNGAFILQDEPRALHIKLDGHPRARAEQAARLKGISLDEATKRLPKEDEFRRSFSLNTYNFDPAGNEYYTLVVNSPKLGVEETVRLILEAAKDL